MTNKQTFPVRLDVEFTDADIDLHIMGSGFTMWEWWYSVNDTPGGYTIEAENPNMTFDESYGDLTAPLLGAIKDEVFTKNVSYDDIRRVMGNMLANAYPNPDYYSLAKQQILDGIMRNGDWDFDSDGADRIMQVAMYGKVVYS